MPNKLVIDIQTEEIADRLKAYNKAVDAYNRANKKLHDARGNLFKTRIQLQATYSATFHGDLLTFT